MARIIFSSTSSSKEARVLANKLLKKHLIACAKIIKTKSLFRWDGKIARQAEAQLILKTRKKCVKKIQKIFKKCHSYEIFEFSILKCKMDKKYKRWLKKSC